MVIVLVVGVLRRFARSTRAALPDAAAAGLLAGFAIGVKPANALFLGGVALAYLAALRWRAGAGVRRGPRAARARARRSGRRAGSARFPLFGDDGAAARRGRHAGAGRRLELGALEVPPLRLGRAAAELRRDPRVLLERARAPVDRDRRLPRRAAALAAEGAAARRLVRGVPRRSRAARPRRTSRRARSSASSCPASRRS